MTHLTNKREAPVSAVGVSGMAAHRASFARYVKDITCFSTYCCLSVCTRLYRSSKYMSILSYCSGQRRCSQGMWKDSSSSSRGTQSSGFSLKAFVDNNRVRDDKAWVRVYHLSPDAGPVNIAVGKTTVITGLTYEHASGYLNVAPGSYTFNVTAVK